MPVLYLILQTDNAKVYVHRLALISLIHETKVVEITLPNVG